MRKPELLDFAQARIRLLHYAWFAFFLTFFVWFNMAPLATLMLKSVDWLNAEHIKVLMICNVALTIPARILVGALIDRYGPRLVFAGLMVSMAIPGLFFAFGTSFVQLLISRLALGSIGAGFVIGIKLVANWFPPKMIGRAEGFYAGWGNFGSAGASFVLAFFAVNVMQDMLGLSAEAAWRWSLAMSSIACAVYGVIFYFIVQDTPHGHQRTLAAKTEPMKVSSYGDLVQYLVWSFPLMGAMGLLAWRLQRVVMTEADGSKGTLFSEASLYVIWAVLGLAYIAHVAKVLQVNLPHLRAGVKPEDRYPWSSVAALNTTYFANFGAELAVVSMLPMFFQTVFQGLTDDSGKVLMTPQLAGMVAGSFAFVNLFARPLGGLLSDLMTRRKTVMLIYMAGIAAGFLGMSFIAKLGPDGQLIPTFDGIGWLVTSVVITVAASIFVQGAEGATFAIIPMIHKQSTGQIAGMAGAYGNVGAVVYLVIFALVDAKTFFQITAAGALFSMLYCWVFLREPQGSHEAHVDEDRPPAPQPAPQPATDGA